MSPDYHTVGQLGFRGDDGGRMDARRLIAGHSRPLFPERSEAREGRKSKLRSDHCWSACAEPSIRQKWTAFPEHFVMAVCRFSNLPRFRIGQLNPRARRLALGLDGKLTSPQASLRACGFGQLGGKQKKAHPDRVFCVKG